MIKGLGMDIEKSARFKSADDSFLKKIFTKNEIERLKNRSSQHLCGLFCAKEAIIKAFGNRLVLSFLEIEINHSNDGAPIAKIQNDKAKFRKIHLSISHSKEYCTAVAIVE